MEYDDTNSKNVMQNEMKNKARSTHFLVEILATRSPFLVRKTRQTIDFMGARGARYGLPLGTRELVGMRRCFHVHGPGIT